MCDTVSYKDNSKAKGFWVGKERPEVLAAKSGDGWTYQLILFTFRERVGLRKIGDCRICKSIRFNTADAPEDLPRNAWVKSSHSNLVLFFSLILEYLGLKILTHTIEIHRFLRVLLILNYSRIERRYSFNGNGSNHLQINI